MDIKDDRELQHWADLVSFEGNQTSSSRGMVSYLGIVFLSNICSVLLHCVMFIIFLQVKKFPRRFKDKQSLKDVLAKLLWLTSGYHAAATFPQLEYAGFLPNAPYRLFADDHNNDIFSNLMFGNKVKALVSPNRVISRGVTL